MEFIASCVELMYILYNKDVYNYEENGRYCMRVMHGLVTGGAPFQVTCRILKGRQVIGFVVVILKVYFSSIKNQNKIVHL